jgi:cell division septation protein DedD
MRVLASFRVGGVRLHAMRRRASAALAVLACAALAPRARADAQVVITPTPAAAPTRGDVFARAQRLVNDGSGAEGRALVDSLLNATEPRSAEEAEVLYWRATLAENWDQAQRDYLRVMLEHERSPFAAPAMLRLAQGELMRADTAAAVRYLDRLLAAWPATTDATALRARLRPVVVATSPGDSARGPVAPAPTPAPASAAGAGRGTLAWSVQIAAFPTAEEAATLVAEMRERGYDVRVDGIAAPFRVRFGYYATRGAAAAAMQAYKDKERGDAFLAQVPRP